MFGLKLLIRISYVNQQFLKSTEYNLVSCFTISCVHVCRHICKYCVDTYVNTVCGHICKFHVCNTCVMHLHYIVCKYVWMYVYTHTAFLHIILEKELWTNPYLDMSPISVFEWSTTRTILVLKKWAPHRNFPQEHFLWMISFPYVHSCSVIHLNFRMIMNVLSIMYFPVRTNRFCWPRVK